MNVVSCVYEMKWLRTNRLGQRIDFNWWKSRMKFVSGCLLVTDAHCTFIRHLLRFVRLDVCVCVCLCACAHTPTTSNIVSIHATVNWVPTARTHWKRYTQTQTQSQTLTQRTLLAAYSHGCWYNMCRMPMLCIGFWAYSRISLGWSRVLQIYTLLSFVHPIFGSFVSVFTVAHTDAWIDKFAIYVFPRCNECTHTPVASAYQPTFNVCLPHAIFFWLG